MSDEEMARLFIIDKYGLRKDLEIFRIKQDEDLCKDFYAFIAGLKAGRPKWHDLRKNPNDLPKEAGYILSPTLLLIKRLKGTSDMSYILGKYNFSEREFEYAHLLNVEEVVAWCEIPKFEEVEELLEGK